MAEELASIPARWLRWETTGKPHFAGSPKHTHTATGTLSVLQRGPLVLGVVGFPFGFRIQLRIGIARLFVFRYI